MQYDVVIVGGGPAGLAAALALGRARRRVLLADSGPRRNQAAIHLHNFVTRDGTPPDEFRRVAREQLATYSNVELREESAASIEGVRGAFEIAFGDDVVRARRVLLCTGMIDELLAIEGFASLWGQSIFQCPYCHGWEVREQKWGYLAAARDEDHLVPFALMARGWSTDLVVFTDGFEPGTDARAALKAAAIQLETAPIRRLVPNGGRLEAVELEGATTITRDVLFAHPPQRQVPLVVGSGVALDEAGLVGVSERGETSVAGLYAAGDLTTRMQAAIMSAAAGAQVAAMINMELAMDVS